jgi:RNA polymerase sigma factor (sigma-70 family)
MPQAITHLLHRLRRLEVPCGDRALLDRFLHCRDEAAFAALVSRHGPLVLRLCRRMLRKEQDAEDAFQATFLVLARRGFAIRCRGSLAAWLYGVAYRIAARSRAADSRRQLREAPCPDLAPPDPRPDPLDELTARELLAVVDEEVRRLPRAYRLPVLLCCLEGKSQEEAARLLGWTAGAVKGRLERGRKRLRDRLARRGLSLPAALAVVCVGQGAATGALPAALAVATARAAVAFTTAGAAAAGEAPAEVTALAEGVLKGMATTHLKIGAALVLLAGALVGGAAFAARQTQPAGTPPPAEGPPQSAGRGAAQPKPGPEGPPRTDVHDDPLPAGALARMGTVRLRHGHLSPFWTAFSPDGKLLASGGVAEIRLWDLASGKLLREIRDGNRTRYCMLAFAPDGRRLAGASLDSVCVWETATGRRLQELPADGQSVACSPDGKLLAAPAKDGSIFLWDTTTGRQTARLRDGAAKGPHWPAFTADGKELVTQSDNRLCHWDLATGKLRKAVEIPLPPRHGMIRSPDGQTLAVCPWGLPRKTPVALWDVATGKERLKLQGELAVAGFGMAFSPDGKTLATNGNNPLEQKDQTTVAFWDVKTGQLLRRLLLPTRSVDTLRFAPDGRTLLTTGHEPVIRLWDTVTGKELLSRPAHVEAVEALAFTPDGRFLVSGGMDRAVRLWEVAGGRHVRELAGHGWRTYAVAVTPDGRAVVSSGADGCVRVQSLDGKPLQRILVDGPPAREGPIHVIALALTPDGKRAVTWRWGPAGEQPVYELWDLGSGKRVGRQPYGSTVISTPHFSPDARSLLESVFEGRANGPAPAAGGGAGGGYTGGPAQVGVRLREVATGREVLTLREGFGDIQAFAPDGRALVTVTSRPEGRGDSGRYENALHLWELATGKERRTIPCGPASVRWVQRVACAADGRTLATARSDGTLQLWDLVTGKELPFRAAPGVEVQCLVFSPDSRLLASAQRDGTILVWDAASARRGEEARRGGEPDSRQLNRWWADLAGEDARRAYGAVCGLAAGPPHALRLFRDRLRPTTEAPPAKLRPLIAELDSPQFERREAARRQLTAFGEAAAPALRAALQAGPSAEQRRRIEQILGALRGPPPSGALRHLRAVEVLERIGSAEAHEVLAKLANGVPEARLTREAKATLERMARRPGTRP